MWYGMRKPRAAVLLRGEHRDEVLKVSFLSLRFGTRPRASCDVSCVFVCIVADDEEDDGTSKRPCLLSKKRSTTRSKSQSKTGTRRFHIYRDIILNTRR